MKVHCISFIVTVNVLEKAVSTTSYKPDIKIFKNCFGLGTYEFAPNWVQYLQLSIIYVSLKCKDSLKFIHKRCDLSFTNKVTQMLS